MELWNEAHGIPRYDVSSWGQVFDKQKFRLLKQTLRGLQPACKGYTFERIGGEAHDS